MKTNLEKWDYYLSIINSKTNDFINSQKEGKIIPSIFYNVYPSGKIAERTIVDVEYSHFRHKGKTYFNGKTPTKKEIIEIKEYSEIEIPFTTDNIYFKYSEIWDKENNRKSTSSVGFNNLLNENGLFHLFLDAEIYAKTNFFDGYKFIDNTPKFEKYLIDCGLVKGVDFKIENIIKPSKFKQRFVLINFTKDVEDINFSDIKKELNITDEKISEMFNYKNKLSYSNSSAKTRIETALVSFYLLIKKSEEKKF